MKVLSQKMFTVAGNSRIKPSSVNRFDRIMAPVMISRYLIAWYR